ncbi:flagellar biosynthesis protein FlhF [Alkalilimnicola ehrlichii MLHE-1]|uniref:Flagellar biosynthesis protein FlhF n=1 Tax=Alkalilimnicola ehrlichii (strain ATCC BAA-1101 / DSM 17681 / MLHE-1) TaxID=187272 RepID=Q0AA01_ALKEH|nr:flagellar biosynthesis protein FlhF [Alkalilimnicola ehrlichii]ABI56336.1 GTP-binding signal recognition particle SRP54, G- domain protein [Alkalilimnicola ehrlichii MLHE-1]
MKIQRIFAEDMRQAIRKVREEHGPEAVILSTKPVEGGVEVISAIDYDERAVQQAAGGAGERGAGRPGGLPLGAIGENRHRRQTTAEAAAAGGASRRQVDITVGDDDDGEALFADLQAAHEQSSREAAAQQPAAGERPVRRRGRGAETAPRVEWAQDPAMNEMREELRQLRGLFESQLSLMEWGRMGQRHPARAGLLKRLADMGMGSDVARRLADHIPAEAEPGEAWARALAIIERNLQVAEDDILEQGGVMALVGPTGVGKTTTVAKLAARFALKHGRDQVALVSTDTFRIGAQDQLRNFASILQVPVYNAASGEELAGVLENLDDKRLVLVDTAGMSQRDVRLAEQFTALRESSRRLRTCLVLSAATQLSTLTESMRAFAVAEPQGCIFTKLDEATSLGGLLTVALRSRLPIAWLGTGQRVPEDLEVARGDRLAELASTLVEECHQEVDEEALALSLGGSRHAGE